MDQDGSIGLDRVRPGGGLPDPLTSADCDLREFPWMQLDVARFRDSELASIASAEAFRCAVLLWCAAWHQVPAASLPDDDVQLARLAGYGRDLETFREARSAGGMLGWVRCSDGRYYHSIIAEKANEAWERSKAQTARTEAARQAKHAKRTNQSNVSVTGSVTNTVTDNVTDTVTETVTGSRGEERRREESKQQHAASASMSRDVENPNAAEDLALLKTEGLEIYQRLTNDPTSLAKLTIERLFKACGEDATKLLTALRDAKATPPTAPDTLVGWLASRLSPPPPDCPALQKAPARSPMLSDPPHLWAPYAEKWEVDGAMVKRPVFAGYYVDELCRGICEAAGIIDPKYRGDWLVPIRWLRDGIEQAHFLDIIRRLTSRPNYRPPTSIAYFDAAVREAQR